MELRCSYISVYLLLVSSVGGPYELQRRSVSDLTEQSLHKKHNVTLYDMTT